MFTLLPVHLLVLTFMTYVSAAATLTPPPLSASGSQSLSLATTSAKSSANASGSGTISATGSIIATSTSSAHFPSLSGLSDCASQCFDLAIGQDNCSSVIQVNCYCANSTRFTSGLVECISASCSSSDLSPAEDIAQQFCAQASTSTSLSFPTVTSSGSSSSFSNPFSSSSTIEVSNSSSSLGASATSPPPSSTSGSGNGAVRLNLPLREMVTAGMVSIGGALLGVLLA